MPGNKTVKERKGRVIGKGSFREGEGLRQNHGTKAVLVAQSNGGFGRAKC